MANYARITLIGNVGTDPTSKVVGSQNLCEFSIAVNTTRNEGGQPKDHTNWYRIAIWGRQADTAMQYIKKGQPLFIEGRLLVREYTKADGTTGYSLDVTGSDFQLLGRKEDAPGGGGYNGGGNGNGNYNGGQQQQGGYQQPRPEAAPAPIRAEGGGAAADDDLPF